MEFAAEDKVAVYTHEYAGRDDRVRLGTVERVTPTQVVLDNGDRFRRHDGHQVAARSGYGPWRELRSLDDPEVRKVRARQAVHRLVRSITNAQRDSRDPLTLLAYIEKETARVRAVVEKLTEED